MSCRLYKLSFIQQVLAKHLLWWGEEGKNRKLSLHSWSQHSGAFRTLKSLEHYDKFSSHQKTRNYCVILKVVTTEPGKTLSNNSCNYYT